MRCQSQFRIKASLTYISYSRYVEKECTRPWILQVCAFRIVNKRSSVPAASTKANETFVNASCSYIVDKSVLFVAETCDNER